MFVIMMIIIAQVTASKWQSKQETSWFDFNNNHNINNNNHYPNHHQLHRNSFV